MARFLIPAFAQDTTAADFGLLPVQFITEWGGLSVQTEALAAACKHPERGPILGNFENHKDNPAAAASWLARATNLPRQRVLAHPTIAAPSKPSETSEVGIYLAEGTIPAWEGAGLTKGGAIDRAEARRRVREANMRAEAWRATYICLDAWMLYDRDGHGICFPGSSPRSTWEEYMLQRIVAAEEYGKPVRAIVGTIMLHNGRDIPEEASVSRADLAAQTRFLERYGVEPILMAGWSGLKYNRERAAGVKNPDGRLSRTAAEDAAILAFADA